PGQRVRADVAGGATTNAISGAEMFTRFGSAALYTIAEAEPGDPTIVDLDDKVEIIGTAGEQIGPRSPCSRRPRHRIRTHKQELRPAAVRLLTQSGGGRGGTAAARGRQSGVVRRSEAEVRPHQARPVALGEFEPLGAGAIVRAALHDKTGTDRRLDLLVARLAGVSQDDVPKCNADVVQRPAVGRIGARRQAERKWQRVFQAPFDLAQQPSSERIPRSPDP